ncbi:MAG: hypothetical protein EIB84_07270 [Spiroplasma poulsonii]|uniref:Uncharacterized protein n=1 Tax=Spiroplasma poulsonii TaxID=2138 RepID=A0A2P6FFT4_9MOLU|nr:hypothetical protein [Spiroplasma poulsonii]KAF0850138.1 putative chitinase-like [Spiroplasma poulsonii]MBW1242532.1 hypothetical protein [Spiroplasma poulsonii]PQM32315.1 hypothetical protein SMSRO_SF022230 [Spiroplasma poulsonii]PWF94971.1 hypothetical protein SMSE_03950 [Spiroplasma poulsonii]PWF97765.1 hypothetical protein SMH99_03140 [Spiroplasma poulsonii]
MKKLLSLLSVLAISGSAVPTTIAASPYQKKQSIRVKRQTQSPIFKTNGDDKPTEQQIKDKLINKYPHIAAEQIKVKNITSTSVNITIDGFSGETTLTFTVDKSVPINDVIKITHLGEIDFTKHGYNEIQIIKDLLKHFNPQLDISKVDLKGFSINRSTIKSTDTSIYTGEIDVNYSRPLKSVITVIELGSIRNNGLNLPTEQEIKNKLKELNKSLENNINYFEVSDITPTNAKISYKRQDILSGEVIVKFISNINLNKIIKNNNLGEFKTENLSNPTKEQIKNKLKEMYTDLDITKINVENITNSSAKITSADENVYTNNVNVNYTVSIDSLNWE